MKKRKLIDKRIAYKAIIVLVLFLNISCYSQNQKKKFITKYYYVDLFINENEQDSIKMKDTNISKNEAYYVIVFNKKLHMYNIVEKNKKIDYKQLNKNVFFNNEAKDTLYLTKHKSQIILKTSIVDSMRYNFVLGKHPKTTNRKLQLELLLNKLWKVKDKSKLFRVEYIKFNADNTAILYSKEKEELRKVKWKLNYLLESNYLIFIIDDIFKFPIIITRFNNSSIEGKVWKQGNLKKIKLKSI